MFRAKVYREKDNDGYFRNALCILESDAKRRFKFLKTLKKHDFIKLSTLPNSVFCIEEVSFATDVAYIILYSNMFNNGPLWRATNEYDEIYTNISLKKKRGNQ